MSESLFQISCPSCESVFAVTDPELIGQIVACPKCGGMILVEAAQNASSERVGEEAQNGQDARDGEDAQVGAETRVGEEAQEGQDKQTSLKIPVGEEARVAEEKRSENVETEGTANENAASGKEKRRVGKLVGGGVALLLVGAAAFLATNGGREDAAPDVEPGVESKIGQNGENGEAPTSENAASDDVGGVAPLTVEDRSAEESESATSTFDPIGEEAGTGENVELGDVEQGAQDGGNSENSADEAGVANLTADESTDKPESGARQNAENGENGENGGNEEIERNGEFSENETVESEENPETDAPDDGLNGLGDLGDLGEEDVLEEPEPGEEDALENGEEESSSENRLAGSNASTGFNEADFERANQNADSDSAEEESEVDWSGVASTTNPTLQGALPTLRRERKEIDVDARLALPIKSIEFPSSPVAALRILSEFTGVSIVPDLETFVLTRPGINATLDLTLRDVTAGEALEKVAELLNWEVCKEKERILIRPAGTSDALVEERFDVADLTSPRGGENAPTSLGKFELPNNLTSETLAALVRSTVAPETWSENGGRATLRVDGSTLIVGQNTQNREKTRILLEGLRAVRALEPQSDASPERIIPEKLGWENLTKKMTFAPLTPPALQNLVEIIENSQKLQVFWDDAALNEAGVGRDATTAVRAESETVDALLSEALEPLNANYLILGEKLILVTGGEVAENYQTIEIFSLINSKGGRPTLDEARTLIAEMKQKVAPNSWEETVGEDRKTGEDGQEETKQENVADEETTLPKEENETALLEEKSETGQVGENSLDGQNRRYGEGEETTGDALLNAEATDAPKAVVWLDVESACLIIRQSQPNQRALRRWLNARLNNSASDATGLAEKDEENRGNK